MTTDTKTDELVEKLNRAAASSPLNSIRTRLYAEIVAICSLWQRHGDALPKDRLHDWIAATVENVITAVATHTILSAADGAEAALKKRDANPLLQTIPEHATYELAILLYGKEALALHDKAAERLHNIRTGILQDFDPEVLKSALALRDAKEQSK